MQVNGYSLGFWANANRLQRLINESVGVSDVKQQNVNIIWLNDSMCLSPFNAINIIYPLQAIHLNFAGQTQWI